MDLNQTLIDELKEIRDKAYLDGKVLLDTFNWDQHFDIRIRSLSKMARMLAGLHLAMHTLIESEESPGDYWQTHSLPQPMPEPLAGYYSVASAFLRNGFISSLFSVVESTLSVYLSVLNPEESAKLSRAPDIAKQLLLKEMAAKQKRGYRGFMLLTHIRNSLHNNGVFNPSGKTTSVYYRCKVYKFNPGELVRYASWELLLTMSRDLAEMLFQVARDQKLIKIRELIPDPSRGELIA